MSFGAEVLLKARLLVEGVRISDAALAGVGRTHKEQLHHLFEYDFDLHKGTLCPADMRLPTELVVQVRLNARSPLVVERREGVLVVEEAGRVLTTAEWLERPAFYALSTSSGTRMSRIAELVGEDCLSVCHTNACILFADGQQCLFCNLNYTPRQYDEVLIRKRAAEVGEVAGAALRERARHFVITGGILPGDREIAILERYLEALRDATGFSDLPGCAIMTPPRELAHMERLRRLGLRAIGFNLECWSPAFFRAVCPGKEQRVGYARYREALRVAVDVFGLGGRVFSGFVAGIEPMEDLLKGVQALAEEGVASIPLIWSPSAGTRLHRHRAPYAEWYVEMSERAANLMIRHLRRDPGDAPSEPVRCARCQNQVLLHDVIQARLRSLRTLTVTPGIGA